MSCLISEPLALDALQSDFSALGIINAELGAIILAEIKFGQIAVKVLLIHMLINADQTAFEDRKEAFKSIGVNVAARPFIFRMIDTFMRCDGRKFIVLRAIAHETAILVDVLIKEGADHPVIERYGTDISAALDKTKDLCLWAARAWALLFIRRPSSLRRFRNERFVGLYGLSRAAQLASRRSGVHRQPDPVAKEPCGFHAAFEHPLNLPGRNAFLAGAHEMDDLQPKMQRQVRVLEKSSHAYRERFFAGVALAEAGTRGFAVQTANLRGFATVRANRTIWPKRGFDISESGCFGLEMRGGKNGLSRSENSYGQNTTLRGLVCQV